MGTSQEAKAVVLSYFDDLEKASGDGVQQALLRHHSPAYHFYGVHPFNEVSSSDAVASAFWQPLKKSFTRVQRRQDVFIAGTSEVANDTWVMSMGHFMGLFDADWLGIPANGKLAMLRYAEFNRVEGGKITHTGMWVDIIGLMQHVGINPLPPETGHYFIYPGPRSHDGLQFEAQPELESQHTLELLNRMIQDLDLLNLSGDDNCQPEYLARTWHEDMAWYGPAGIGATYTIERYQRQHQYPFREGLTNKVYNGHVCRFAEGNYACFFGWPNLSHQPTGGFLGLPGGSPSEMRVVDVYRREGEKLSENWVLIDLPHWLLKQGLDVLERTRSIVNP
ncbi:MAG: ester cyclase [Pseudomonadota bacterium]